MIKRISSRLRLSLKLAIGTIFILFILWFLAFITIGNIYSQSFKLAQQRTISKSQIFAEHTVSTIKRMDQILREARTVWQEDPSRFARFIEQQYKIIEDITFQIAVINQDGILVFSNLTPSADKVDLSMREHFRVHQETQGADNLFISPPVVGKISKKWAIQFTRPLFKDNHFNGVLVASVDPPHFSSIGKSLNLADQDVLLMTRATGEHMAKFPTDETLYDQVLPDTLALLQPQAPLSGNFKVENAADGLERIYGYTRLPAYGLNMLVGESLDSAFETYQTDKALVVAIGLVLSFFPLTTAVFLFVKVTEKRQHDEAMRIAAMVYKNSGEAMMLTDSKNTIFSINPSFTSLTGYRMDEVIGKSPQVLSSGTHDMSFWRVFWNELITTNQWRGELRNRRKNGDLCIESLTIDTIYSEYSDSFIRVTVFRDVTQEKAIQEKIWHDANYDVLTGLPNRRSFLEKLDQEMKRVDRNGEIFALIFMDIDHFKTVNDTFGHTVGDELLLCVASRLRKNLRQVDTIARMGGDEYTMILSGLSHVQDIESICSNLLRELAVQVQLKDHSIYITVSMGIAIYPQDGFDSESMLKCADQAMYVSKRRGRNQSTFFLKSMQEETSKRMHLTNDLHLALSDDQLVVFYQPIINLSTGRICKAEALVRWQHPTLGLLGPSYFIPYAEEVGLIGKIDHWVMQQVTTQLRNWSDCLGKDLQVSVNKSGMEFRSQDAMRQVIETCLCVADQVVIEVTEGVLIDDTPININNMMKLHESGLALALDDFGVGYSSLSYVARFPFTYIKIDQTFVSKLIHFEQREVTLLESIILLAHKLGIKVIAEGVETKEQSDWLVKTGCDYGQGYFYGYPMTAEVFEKTFKQSARAGLHLH